MLDKFTVGSRWFRRDYEFQVVSNNGQMAEYVKVEPDGTLNSYVGGIIDVRGAPLQMKIHDNIAYEKNYAIKKSMGLLKAKKAKAQPLDMSNVQAHFFTLGFLVKNAFFGMRVIDKTKDEEGEWYKDVAGKFPWEEESGYEFDAHPETWATKIFIAFDLDLLSKNLIFPTQVVQEDNTAYVYNTVWCRQMIENGFRLGRKHNVEKIRSNVPKEYLTYFEEGLK